MADTTARRLGERDLLVSEPIVEDGEVPVEHLIDGIRLRDRIRSLAAACLLPTPPAAPHHCGPVRRTDGPRLSAVFLPDCDICTVQHLVATDIATMAKLLDLTGQRFGQLTVVRRELNDSYGRLGKMWLCRCDCGKTEVLAQYRLPRLESLRKRPSVTVVACEDCRGRRSCAVCDKGFSSAAANACCSETCHRIHKRRIELRCRERTAERQRREAAAMPVA